MANRALTFGYGGYADLGVTFGEFFQNNHTVTVRFMPQHPYAGAGPMVAENGTGSYMIGQGDYRWGSGAFKSLGPSTLFIQLGSQRVVYEVPGFVDQVGGPVGYRDVWQHLAVVRDGQTMRLYLNGSLLSPFNSAELTVPNAGLPSSNTAVRVGRRSSGSDESRQFWQFYGLIDDVGLFTKALGQSEIQGLASSTALSGNESGLLAGWTFDTGALPASLSRPVNLPDAADIPDDVNSHAAQPVPVYFVTVSSNRDSAQDRKKMDIRPSKLRTTLPFFAGEHWRVVQGWEHPQGSHNGGTAGYCWDLARTNGTTEGSKIYAAAPGRIMFVEPAEEAMTVYHAPHERAVYMHLKPGFYAKYFPASAQLPQNLPVNQQPMYKLGDSIADVGHHDNGDHLHFTVSSIAGEMIADVGPSVPAALDNYYLSKDDGKSWTKVDRGIPVAGDLVARYPWSPWGNKGDNFEVAPAVASWGPGRLDVFVRGENGGLWHKRWTTDKGWSEWRDLGGRLTSAPAIASWGTNRLDVFVRGFEGGLAHERWTNDKDWSEWRDLGGRLTSSPGTVSWGPDRIDVFVRGFEHQLAQKRWNAKGWSEWRNLDK